jgi:hypothetical protein
MKTMWITTGLVIGIGIAATISAADGGTPSRIVPAEVVETGDSTNLETATTVVGVDDSTPVSTSTSVAVIHPFVSVPATTPNASPSPATTVASTTAAAPVPSTTPLPSTTFIPSTTSYWKNVGDPCDSPGTSGVSGSGVTLVCVDGSWQTV